MPSYSQFSNPKLLNPLGLCSKIESLVRKFGWGQKGDRRKIHWVKWDTLCHSKSNDGMGFKNLARFNDALLSRQVWRLLHHKISLFYWVLKSKFFPNCSIMEGIDSTLASYVWLSILKGRDVLLKEAKWRVGLWGLHQYVAWCLVTTFWPSTNLITSCCRFWRYKGIWTNWPGFKEPGWQSFTWFIQPSRGKFEKEHSLERCFGWITWI